MKLKRWDNGETIHEGPYKTMTELVEYCAKNGISMHMANLRGVDLRWADLEGAFLEGADLRWADLEGAFLEGADLREADLRGADLRGADLRWANLEGVLGIVAFCGVGFDKRFGFVWFHQGVPVASLGCHCAPELETMRAIVKKYGPGSAYQAVIYGAFRALEEYHA